MGCFEIEAHFPKEKRKGQERRTIGLSGQSGGSYILDGDDDGDGGTSEGDGDDPSMHEHSPCARHSAQCPLQPTADPQPPTENH